MEFEIVYIVAFLFLIMAAYLMLGRSFFREEKYFIIPIEGKKTKYLKLKKYTHIVGALLILIISVFIIMEQKIIWISAMILFIYIEPIALFLGDRRGYFKIESKRFFIKRTIMIIVFLFLSALSTSI